MRKCPPVIASSPACKKWKIYIRRLWKIHCAGIRVQATFFQKNIYPFCGKIVGSPLFLFSQTLLGPVLALRALVFVCQNDPSCGAAKRKSTQPASGGIFLLGARQKTRFVFAFWGRPTARTQGWYEEEGMGWPETRKSRTDHVRSGFSRRRLTRGQQQQQKGALNQCQGKEGP